MKLHAYSRYKIRVSQLLHAIMKTADECAINFHYSIIIMGVCNVIKNQNEQHLDEVPKAVRRAGAEAAIIL